MPLLLALFPRDESAAGEACDVRANRDFPGISTLTRCGALATALARDDRVMALRETFHSAVACRTRSGRISPLLLPRARGKTAPLQDRLDTRALCACTRLLRAGDRRVCGVTGVVQSNGSIRRAVPSHRIIIPTPE